MENVVQRVTVKLLKFICFFAVISAFPFTVLAGELPSAEQNVHDCSHLLISHIRSFPPSWSGFKSIDSLAASLSRRKTALILFRVPLENYIGSSSILNFDLGENSLKIQPDLKIFIGSNLYAVGEGSSNQILLFAREFSKRFPEVRLGFQILDSEPLIQDLAVNAKIQRVDLSVQDPQTVLKNPLHQLKENPHQGFVVHEEQMNGTLYFFSTAALGPILQNEEFLHHHYLSAIEADATLSLTEAIENHQPEFLSDEAVMVRWHDLIIMNGSSARTILDLRGQGDRVTQRSSVQVHTRLLDLIRECQNPKACDLIDETMKIIASLTAQKPVSEPPPSKLEIEPPAVAVADPAQVEIPVAPTPPPATEPPPSISTGIPASEPEDDFEDEEPVAPSKPKRNVTPAFHRQPRYIRERIEAAAVTPPKRASAPAKSPTPASEPKTESAENRPLAEPLVTALILNQRMVSNVQSDPIKMATWVRSEENQTRLRVAAFFESTIQPLLAQYDQSLRDQDEVRDDAELLALLKTERDETARKLNLARHTLAELLAIDKQVRAVLIEINGQFGDDVTQVRDMYKNLAKRRSWKVEIRDEKSGNYGLKSVTMIIEGPMTAALIHEAGTHRFIGYSTAAGSNRSAGKTRTSFVTVTIDHQTSLTASQYVRTYDIRKSDSELEKLFDGEALAEELDENARAQAIARFLILKD